jgi:hypothetical protein
MYCKVCGDERDVQYYPAKRQTLCPTCAAETPRKVSRRAFDAAYWDGEDDCPESTRREFYEDYLHSDSTLEDYIERTVSVV